MKAAVCHAYGDLEQVVVEDVPSPTVGEGQVRVEVHAAAVNFPDVLIVANRYQISVPPPFTPGSELAGVVREVGPGVSDLEIGDRVYGGTIVGAFAEEIVLPAMGLQRMPETATFAQAAAFGVVYATAYHSLRSVAEVAPGDWVVVLGAAGGVGTAAVEVAKLLGGRVLAAASSDEKLALCRELGADAVVNYDAEDLKERIKEITGGGADVVIDPVGGRYSEPALRATRFGGRFVVVGFAAGEIPRIPLNLVLLKGMAIKGFEFGSFGVQAPEAAARDRSELLEHFAAGRLRPRVSQVFPLGHTRDAMQAVADRRALGKVIIDPRA